MRERDQLQARDPKRKKMILENKSTTPSLSTSDIAVKAGCTLNYVSRVLKAEQNSGNSLTKLKCLKQGTEHRKVVKVGFNELLRPIFLI